VGARGRRYTFDYRVLPGAACEDRIELHVLVRAYRDCWIALHAEEPRGRHWLTSLGIAIDFYAGGGPA
jgi:hypothetical protein